MLPSIALNVARGEALQLSGTAVSPILLATCALKIEAGVS